MREILDAICKDVLSSIYYPFWFACFISFLFMFFFLRLQEKSFMQLLEEFVTDFKKDKEYRSIFILAMYVICICYHLFYTTNLWINPIVDVLGGWGFATRKDEFTTDYFQNLLLYIPFIILLFHAKKKKYFPQITFGKVIQKAFVITLKCSLCIEFLQLILRNNYVQIADVVYNVIGGVMGGCLYYLLCKKKEENE